MYEPLDWVFLWYVEELTFIEIMWQGSFDITF